MSCFDNYDSQILKNLVLQGESNTTISKLLGLTVSQVRVRVKRDGLIGIRPAGGAHHKPKPKKPKPKKPKPEPKPMPPGHNGNRKKCKTCKWRGTGPIGCNYAAYHDRPRSAICTVEDCTVYEKGKTPRNHISI